MASYQYQAWDKNGEKITGVIDAPDESNAINRLQEQQITVTELSEQKATDIQVSLPSFLKPKSKITDDEVILLTRQLYSLTKAGVPIIRTLNGLSETTHNKRLSEALKNVAEALVGGSDLASAFATEKKIFSSVYVSMVHIGETTGKLDDALAKLVKHLEFNREIKKRIKSAMRYPIMVVSAIAIAITLITMFVIPQFSSVFEKLGADLPLPTVILVSISDFMQNYWWLILIILIGVFFAYKQFVKTEKGCYIKDREMLKLPLLGGIFQRIALARFSRSFSMMMSAGVPLVQCLNIVADTVGNSFVAKHIRSMQAGIEVGERIVSTANQTEMFTPLVLQMIAVGEETGSVDTLLGEVADFYEEEIDYELKMLSDAIEPILLVFLGIMVLVLALGVFLPIWDLGKAALPS